MILRKPYAILIKNFKLIHLILSALMLYLIYKTYNILSFLREYLNTIATTISNDITKSLFGYFPVLVSVFIIIISLIIFALMKFKDKPIKTYVYNTLAYTLFIIYYLISASTIRTLEINLVDVRVLKMLKDFTTIALFVEIVGFIIILIRSTGFDIKSFNFKKDLEDLNIETEDSEEFEVNTEIDTSKIKRLIKKKIRHLKYAYFENQLLLNILISIVIVVCAGFVIYNKTVVHKVYKMNEAIVTSKYNIVVEDAYSTNLDYKNNIISTSEKLFVIRFKTKTLFGKSNLGLAAFQLNIEGYKYNNLIELKDDVLDFGKIFNDQKITNEYSEYILVFKVPNEKLNKKIILKYYDNLKVYSINIKAKDLNVKENVKSYSLGEEIDFKESILKNTKINIKTAEIESSFKDEYQYCYDTCTTYYEYIVPSTEHNAEKILKIDGEYTYDSSNDQLNNMFKFIKTFGTIKYSSGTSYKTMSIGINRVKPKRIKGSALYIELDSDAANAEHLIIEFNIRGKMYTYSVK